MIRFSLIIVTGGVVICAGRAHAQSDSELFAEGRIALDEFKDCAAAIKALSQVSAEGRDPVWSSYMARSEECVGNLKTALKYYERYNKAMPGHTETINKIGELRYKLQKETDFKENEALRQQQAQVEQQQRRQQAVQDEQLRKQQAAQDEYRRQQQAAEDRSAAEQRASSFVGFVRQNALYLKNVRVSGCRAEWTRLGSQALGKEWYDMDESTVLTSMTQTIEVSSVYSRRLKMNLVLLTLPGGTIYFRDYNSANKARGLFLDAGSACQRAGVSN